MTEDRPRVVCHMIMALDGRTIGPFLSGPEGAAINDEYERTHASYGSNAWLCGRVTMDEEFTFHRVPEVEPGAETYPREDWVAEHEENDYVIAADPSGKLAWEQNTLEYLGRPVGHIVEALTARAPDSYITYLRRHKISYVFAGEETLDCRLLVHKLGKLFGIRTLMLEGGGLLNCSFLDAGVIDELSVILAPVADGQAGKSSLFDRASYLPARDTARFRLKGVEEAKEGCLWIRYVPREAVMCE